MGGGNLEATAVDQARTMIAEEAREPIIVTLKLSDKAPSRSTACNAAEERSPCCAWTFPVTPSVATFGDGATSGSNSRASSLGTTSNLFWSTPRAEMLTDDRLDGLAERRKRDWQVRQPVAPDQVLPELPPGTHVLIASARPPPEET